jgi:hypothetical protein
VAAIQGTGALSPDGRRFAYVAVWNSAVFVETVDLETGRRDSIQVSDRAEAPAGAQAATSTPVFSPSGDSLAFLLPNPLTMQLLIYELPTRRLETFAVPLQVTTRYTPLRGTPRWTRADAAIRFLARGRTGSAFEDSLFVLKVFPREHGRVAEVAFAAPLPDTTRAIDLREFSFDETGETVAFIAETTRPAIHFLRRGAAATQPLLDEPGQFPRAALLVP